MKSALAWIAAIAIFAAPPVSVRSDTTRGGYPEDLPLQSVLNRERDILASNASGLYRAEKTNHEWKRLNSPETMPLNGGFADEPATSNLILYYTPRWTAAELPNSEGKIFGLYISPDDGQTWELVSQCDNYYKAFLHPNGHLFVVTGSHVGDEPVRILESTDLAKTWRDITGKSFGEIAQVFQDPDHPDLICLVVNAIRNYILQATDKSYEWQATREWDWWPKHQTETRFFARYYSTGSTLYMMNATLRNYFSHDFNGQAALPAFEIAPQKKIYEFRKDEPKPIRLSILFWAQRSTDSSEPTGQDSTSADQSRLNVSIIDQDQGVDLWGLNVETGDHAFSRVQAAFSRLIYESKDRAQAITQLRKVARLRAHELGQSPRYDRLLDLNRLFDFSVPGTFKVQLVYDNSLIADRARAEWVGSFTSPMFTIVVR